jgi:2-oxoglutarate dehydrogenase E2 component (dihydrolipoamide succinyltransferase)
MAASENAPLADFGGSNTEVKEMDAIGRIIADRMVLSKKVSAHVTTVVEVDVTKLVNWRNKNKEAFKKHEGISLSYLPSIVEATSKALIEFPKVNSSVDGYRYILKKEINIGIAVSLDDGNLIVPVVHDADKLSISGLAQNINKLALKARSNKLALDDIQGGTFTITNFGTFRNIIGTPIINQPEVAILGIGYIEKKPAVIETPEGDVIAIRHKMYLSLSYDHRIINGALGGAFLKRIADYLENWEA